MNAMGMKKSRNESVGKPGMCVAARRPFELIASRSRGKVTFGMICAGWRSVRTIERRAISKTW